MSLFFITGNKGKFDEVKAIIPDVEQLDIDLPEIQEIDSHKIIQEKLKEAMKVKSGNFIVEDNSLTIVGMNGLPGPLIKWFVKSIGNEGLFKLSQTFGNKAEAKVVIGYTKDSDSIEFFEGIVEGIIVEPKGTGGFGWDQVFQPNGHTKTQGEMTLEEKNEISCRGIAARKLKDFLKL